MKTAGLVSRFEVRSNFWTLPHMHCRMNFSDFILRATMIFGKSGCSITSWALPRFSAILYAGQRDTVEIVNEGVALRFPAGNELAITFDYVGVERHADRHQIEFWLMTFVRLCRELTQHRVLPGVRLKLIHQRKGVLLPNCNHFWAAVSSSGPMWMRSRSPSPPTACRSSAPTPISMSCLTRYCEEALAHRMASRGLLRPDLENAIAAILPHGKVRAGEIARKLGMSCRTLARRLESEGSSFAAVMDELKRDLANRYLRDKDLSISRIAWLLGYREGSAFTHAFKRWTGKNPREARSQETSIHKVKEQRSGAR